MERIRQNKDKDWTSNEEKLYWLLEKGSELSIQNNYIQTSNETTWSYSIELWGRSSESNTQKIQGFHNKELKNNVNAPWYVTNRDLHRDIVVWMVAGIIK